MRTRKNGQAGKFNSVSNLIFCDGIIEIGSSYLGKRLIIFVIIPNLVRNIEMLIRLLFYIIIIYIIIIDCRHPTNL